MKLVLASASPRRAAILKNLGYKILIMPSSFDEKINGLIYSDNLVENCAYQKALDIKKQIDDNQLIISADTVVVNNGIILGKPNGSNEAFTILKELSNKTHFVATSICLIYKKQVLKNTQKTYVTFRELSDSDILNYLERCQPFDKAGSYGIQDEGFDFAVKINGDLDNVIGFPLRLFKSELNKISF